MVGQNLWMSFLVVENLDDSNQFILGRDCQEVRRDDRPEFCTDVD